MRTLDISYTVDDTTRTGTIEYPDYWCFMFNPLYVTITLDDTSLNGEVVLTLSSNGGAQSIYVNLYKGAAKVYVSKIMQLLLDDVDHRRYGLVQMSITEDDVSMFSTSVLFMAVWGGLRIGDQFGSNGAFEYNGTDLSHVRNVVWFKNFPFYVSMFRSSTDETVYAKYDGNDYDDELVVFRYEIDVIEEGDLPDFEDSTITVSTSSTDDSTPLVSGDDPSYEVVLNITNGIIYLHDTANDLYYISWSDGTWRGSRGDYMKDVTNAARTDTEWSYNGDIIRWNEERMEVEYATAGNADETGIFDLCPALTFPDAEESAQYIISIGTVTTGIFDAAFNIIFPDTTKKCNETVNITISDAQDGIYLRWIDRYGLLQYYLFVEGQGSVKASGSDDYKHVDRSYYGMAFGKLQRFIEETNVETVKCCAMNLPKSILAYVKTIVNSPIVDIYLGATRGGTELWVPVMVADGTYTTDPDTELTDFEISIEKMEEVTQSL